MSRALRLLVTLSLSKILILIKSNLINILETHIVSTMDLDTEREKRVAQPVAAPTKVHSLWSITAFCREISLIK